MHSTAMRRNTTRRDCDIGNFLEDIVWEDADGTILSVLSLLARLDLDPWAEARLLRRLPRAEAIERLADAIRSAPVRGQPLAGATLVAARLLKAFPPDGQARTSKPPHRRLRESLMGLLAMGVAAAWLSLFAEQHRKPAEPAPAVTVQPAHR